MSIQQSRDHITRRMTWEIDEDTFQVLSEGLCVWIARVTTTHRKKAYEDAKQRAEGLPPGLDIDIGTPEEHSFVILVQGFNCFELNNELLPALLDWCLKQAK